MFNKYVNEPQINPSGVDLGFIIARLDLGMKAMNPAFSIDDKNHFPILSPKWKRDRAWHFAVGYPF